MTSFSGGEIRMGQRDTLYQGIPVGYRLVVFRIGDNRSGVEARAETMEPLLSLLQQFEELGYEFACLERVFGG